MRVARHGWRLAFSAVGLTDVFAFLLLLLLLLFFLRLLLLLLLPLQERLFEGV